MSPEEIAVAAGVHHLLTKVGLRMSTVQSAVAKRLQGLKHLPATDIKKRTGRKALLQEMSSLKGSVQEFGGDPTAGPVRGAKKRLARALKATR
jgi:hypothetical protein